MESLQKAIGSLAQHLYSTEVEVALTRPDAKFGDFATNAALQLAGKLGKNPREIALTLAEAIKKDLADSVVQAEVAGPGFINIRLSQDALIAQLYQITDLPKPLAGKTIVAEYSDPNPFKVLHAGHLYTSIVGDAIANLLETAGATVHRTNYGGDVGLHVGKTMWAILKALGGESPDKLQEIPREQHAAWLAACYVEGNNTYEEDETAKAEMIALNKRVYQLHVDGDRDSAFAQIYWTTRQWSYDYFDEFYERIGTKFEKYYPESEVVAIGVKKVKEQLKKGVFKESAGAVVFDGEKHGLHTRVFTNSEGLPTYETKEVGLLFKKKNDYNFDLSVVITGNEQEQYMQVVLKAIEQFAPELVRATKHLTHGIVKLQGGEKMSSRKGNILRAVDVLDAAEKANQRKDDQVTIGAVKYAFLKVRTGGDIIYDPKESVSLEGNSGPYLQYAHARAHSILEKLSLKSSKITTLDEQERLLAAKLTEFTEIVSKAVNDLSPHIVCTYLYELCQAFNRFYENNRVIGDKRERERAELVRMYADVLKTGLSLLGIQAPKKM